MKRPIQSSHLALRFYVRDGWTPEDVDALLVTGKCTYRRDRIDPDCDYFAAYGDARIDLDKLCDAVSVVYRYPGCETESTDRQYMARICGIREGFND